MGCVYILTNEGMPDLVKIGQTSGTAEERAKQLSKETGVPFPFQVAFAQYCKQYLTLERDIHSKLADYRISKKEFFSCPVNDAIRLLKDLYSDDLTTEIQSLESHKTKLVGEIEKAKKAEQELLLKGRSARQQTISLESEVERLKAEVANAHQQIEALKSEAESQKIQKKSLRGEIQSLESRKTVLQKSCAEAEKRKQALLMKERSGCQQIDFLKGEIERLEPDKDRLRKEVESLEKQKRELKKQINAIGKRVIINPPPPKRNTLNPCQQAAYKAAAGQKERFK